MSSTTATITYHAAHNYGSMLQAYALQQTLCKLGYENDIINLRTERQKNIYGRFCNIPVRNIVSLLKRIFVSPYMKINQRKYDLFEKFLDEDLKLTKEYRTFEELEKADFSYDCYISGGDQIWNTAPKDFDWSFYLPFVKKGKRISYAVSMGPAGEKQMTDKERVKEYLSHFAHISVREEGTAAVVCQLVDTPVSMELDPALLLTPSEWEKKMASAPVMKGDYILLYSPGYNKSVYDMAKRLSAQLGMKVVVTLFTKAIYSYRFEKCLATGPWEFLNLVKHARLVVSGSFHALVFATLFHIPFFAVDGDKDNRMVTFLSNMKLLDRIINKENYSVKSACAFITDYTAADEYIAIKRKESLEYLKHSIDN